MREIVFTHQYKKDLKLARKRNLPEDKLNEVIFNLANDIPLTMDKKDHQLTGKLKKEDSGELHILNLVRTGTHSDLFKK